MGNRAGFRKGVVLKDMANEAELSAHCFVDMMPFWVAMDSASRLGLMKTTFRLIVGRV